MLIDVSYFTEGPRHILYTSTGKMLSPEAEAANAAIKAYIRRYQLPFLRAVLDSGKAVELQAYLKKLDENPKTAPIPDYDMVIELLREPFADYVFYKILRDANTQSTITGLVRLKCANDYVAPLRRQVSVWNDMVDMIRDFDTLAASEGLGSWISFGTNVRTKINALNL